MFTHSLVSSSAWPRNDRGKSQCVDHFLEKFERLLPNFLTVFRRSWACQSENCNEFVSADYVTILAKLSLMAPIPLAQDILLVWFPYLLKEESTSDALAKG